MRCWWRARSAGGRIAAHGRSAACQKVPAPLAARAGPRPGSRRRGSSLFASTVVTQGVGVARGHATGRRTAVGRIGAGAGCGRRARLRTCSTRRAAWCARWPWWVWRWPWRWCCLPGCGTAGPLLESVLLGIALAMAILPEEIPVVLTVFLALGAWRLSQQKVLTRRVQAVEALGAITVLAVDKTGTLTQNRMQVAELRSTARPVRRGSGRRLPEAFHELAEFAMLATPADPVRPDGKGDPALRAADHLRGTEHVHDGLGARAGVPAVAGDPGDDAGVRGTAARRAPAGHQGRARGGGRPVPPRRTAAEALATASARRWPSAACACSAWRVASGRARELARQASTTSTSTSWAWSAWSIRRGPEVPAAVAALPARRRARDHDDRRPPGHGACHRAAGGPVRDPADVLTGAQIAS